MFARRAVLTAARVASRPAAATAVKELSFRGGLARPLSTYFAESHEYIKMDGDVGTIGITAHAAEALGDIVYVDLPDEGSDYEQKESFGSVESVKAASDVYVPVAGEVVEVNEELSDSPSLVNESPLEDGWFVKIKVSDKSQLEGLMDEGAYKAFCDSQ